MTILAGVALLAWAYLLLLHGRFWSAGPVLAGRRLDAAPALDVVVPARDEAEGIGAALRSLLAQEYPGRLRIFVVDDGSTDGTGAIARRAGDARLIVVDGAARPVGWSGKLWAVSQGVDACGGVGAGVAAGAVPALAGGPRVKPGDGGEPIGDRVAAPLVLLTDADIVHEPLHLATLVGKLEADGLDLVSEMVELRCRSMAERALVPAFVFFFQLLYPFALVNDPRRRVAAAAGGRCCCDGRALARIGGIAALRGALIDDVALAAAVKPGGPIWLGHSGLARSVRPYPGAADIWRMVARTAYVQLRFSPVLLVGTVLGLILVWLAPPTIALFGTGPARWMAAAAWAGSMASYLPTLRRFRQSPLWALALPGIAVFYLAATIGSAVDHHRGRGVTWKRRSYQGAGA